MITAVAFLALAAGGSIVRFFLRGWSTDRFAIPVGTLVANLAGCFLLGLVAGWSPPAATVVGTAGLGALTTFSSFAAEVVDGWRYRRMATIVYLSVSLIGGIALAHLGLQISD